MRFLKSRSIQAPHKAATLLVIDDDPTIRLAAEDLLASDGFQVLCIETPQLLPKLLQTCQPDAFLIDVNLPYMNGYKVCEYIRGEGGFHLVPILMMTASDELESVSQAYEAGATDFISKPINYSLLIHRIKYMLRNFYSVRHSLQQQNSLIQAQHVARLGYWSLDIEGNVLDIEPYSASLLGWENIESPPVCYLDLLTYVEPADLAMVKLALHELQTHKTPFSIQHRVRLNSGDERILNHQGDLFESDGGRYVRAIGTVQDITERKRAEYKIYEMAYYDNLTSLPNRAFLKEFGDRFYTPRWQALESFAVICIALKHFNRINDSFGQDIGDELLRRVGNRLNTAARSKQLAPRFQELINNSVVAFNRNVVDMVARVDTHSFILCTSGLHSEQHVAQLCESLQTIIAEPFTIHGTSIFLTAALGVACLNDEMHSVTALIDAALSAVNFAKLQEHNQCVFFSADMMTQARDRLELEKDLRASLKRGDFFLVYQPKLNLVSLEIEGFEALVRWQHPTRGLIAPNEFIPLAEETGLIEELGLFVIQQTCEDLKTLEMAGHCKISMALNISARQFSQSRFTDLVSEVIQKAGVNPKKLELEITESIIMNNVQHAIKMLHTLKDIGVKIALDDFGTGYSSFSYLTKFPFDTLKIDQEFLRSVPENPNAVAIVVSIISLAKGLGMQSVAEGIETPQQLRMLADIKSNFGQGYLISEPKTFVEVMQLLTIKSWAHLLDQDSYSQTPQLKIGR